MAGYTEEENRRRAAMQSQERADEDRRLSMWHAAPVGWSETETVYVIEYRNPGDPSWYGCSPFHTPLRLRPEETHNQYEAEEVARLILAGEWAKNRQEEPGAHPVDATRVIERISTGKIILHVS